MLGAAFAGYQKYRRMFSGSRYAALRLTSEPAVKVASAIVLLTNLIAAKCHCAPNKMMVGIFPRGMSSTQMECWRAPNKTRTCVDAIETMHHVPEFRPAVS